MNARRISFGMTGSQKYRAKPTEVDGIRFASKKEAARWKELLVLQASGVVKDIQRQVEYRLEFAGQLLCKYRADFVYDEMRKGLWHSVTEDVKGYKTPMYALKRKMMKVMLGIEIRET